MSRRKERFSSDEEKLEICRQTAYPSVSVAQVARRYAANAIFIFKRLKEPRFAPGLIEGSTDTVFLTVEVGPRNFAAEPVPELPEPVAPLPGRIKIELAGGQWTSAAGGFDREVLACLTSNCFLRIAAMMPIGSEKL